MSTMLRPTGITLDKQQGELRISWPDGRECVYPLSHLREACPCVECRGGHSRMGREYDPDNILKLVPKRSYQIKSIELVGNYALQPIWDDGHSSGIYAWEYLRRICPPEEPAK
ncbi:MAG: DUF971 domain-containing protein [Chloroflexi bacterium]|nr:MAG: hypothetical protein UZ13_01947 [Chloroflexi bacterium OLB13]MBC6955296.1 DUF971 domain-containing protein [Chloroflexota bacterium]MBV6435886.1 hypothetical protein [Anaerolineae bacterium]MDL1915143.1 DUF971 domain-containing protein [Anaerolineae bacterium CFX4]OQY86850.1 MAG: hypothetical protein B6D42_00470 [Anaerolineae bacterium UTCFX5]